MVRMLVLLVVAALAGACATTPQARAIQGTAVGGGMVAVGSTGLVGATASAVIIATLPTPGEPADYLGPIALAAFVPAVILAGGIFVIRFNSDDLDAIATVEPTRAISIPVKRAEHPVVTELRNSMTCPNIALVRETPAAVDVQGCNRTWTCALEGDAWGCTETTTTPKKVEPRLTNDDFN